MRREPERTEMVMNGKYAPLLLLLAFVSGIACSNAVKTSTCACTPEELYDSGIRKLEAGDTTAAEADFRRAIELGGKSPYGYAGMAYLEMKRSNYDRALKYADRALKRDADFAEAHAVKGYVLALRKRGRGWFGKARKHLERALALDPGDTRTVFYLAECNLWARNFGQAEILYRKAAEGDGPTAETARRRLSLVMEIIEAAPVSPAGADIALEEAIDRSDLCVLLVEEFGFKEKLRRYRPELFRTFFEEDGALRNGVVKTPPDLSNHPARDRICEMLPFRLSGLDVLPNGYYYPGRTVDRAQFAVVMQGVLATLENDPGLAGRYAGTGREIPDVRPDYYAFNAVSLCVERGIMSVEDGTGCFDPQKPVSGVEAVSSLRRLEEVLYGKR